MSKKSCIVAASSITERHEDGTCGARREKEREGGGGGGGGGWGAVGREPALKAGGVGSVGGRLDGAHLLGRLVERGPDEVEAEARQAERERLLSDAGLLVARAGDGACQTR